MVQCHGAVLLLHYLFFFLNNLKRKSFLKVLPVYLTPTLPTDLLDASNGEKGSKFQYNFKSCPTFSSFFFFAMMGPQSFALFNADPLFEAYIMTSKRS